MTIVRELVTRLGFTFDRTNLERFERSIVGFKTKTTIAAGVIGAAFKKVLDYASEFSDKVLNTAALAKFAKTTTEQVQALQNVFNKFNVPPEVFQNFYGTLTMGIKEASRGVNNQFRQLVTQSQGAVRLFVNGQLTTSKQAIDDIYAYIRKISNDSEKLRIVQNIFGVDLQTADAIVQLSNFTKGEFDSLIEKEKQAIGNLDEATQSAREFKQQISALGVEWDKFKGKVAALVVPSISKELKSVNDLIETGNVSSFLRSEFPNLIGHAKSLFGIESNSEHQQRLFERDDEFVRRVQQQEISRITNQNNGITNNNKFEFNVQGGSIEQQQVNSMVEQFKQTLNSFWDEKTRELINNNPEME